MVTSRAVVGSSAISSCGVAGQGHGDHGPLAHAAATAGAGIRGPGAPGSGMPTSFSISTAASSASARGQPLVQPEHLGDLVADGEDRVEGGHRLLEDHGDPVAPDPAHLVVGAAPAGPAPRSRISPRDDPAGRVRDEPHDGQGRHALAAARLADDAERFPPVHVQVDPVHRRRDALVGDEVGFQAPDFQQDLAAFFHGPALGHRRHPCCRVDAGPGPPVRADAKRDPLCREGGGLPGQLMCMRSSGRLSRFARAVKPPPSTAA